MRTIKRLKFVFKKDRLSDLHDDILIQILSFLDAKSAAQTCVLSERWNNKLWMHYPDVHLDSKAFGETSEKFEEFVDMMLKQHDKLPHKLRSLSFTWTFEFSIPRELLDKVHAYAQFHDIRHFDLSICCAPHRDYPYPSQNFNPKSLTTLKLNLSNSYQGSLCSSDANLDLLRRYLSGCTALNTLWLEKISIEVCSGNVDLFSSLVNLTELHIIGCYTIRRGGSFLVGAPRLERLTILENSIEFHNPVSNKTMPRWEISSRVLKYLRTDLWLSGPPVDQLPRYIDEIEIDFPSFADYRTARYAKWLINKVRCLPHAKSVTLSKSILQVISAFPDIFESRVPPPLRRFKWQHLKVITANELPTREFRRYLPGLAVLTENCSKTLKLKFV